jgi:hypothetical protein
MTTAQPSIFASILTWSEGRPLWQRDALSRIVAQGSLTHGDKPKAASERKHLGVLFRPNLVSVICSKASGITSAGPTLVAGSIAV